MEVIKNTLSVGATEPFVLLHISDIHLSEFDENDTPERQEFAKKRKKHFSFAPDAVEFVKEYVKKTGYILVNTGDMVDFITPETLRISKSFIEETNMIFVTGNHEFWHCERNCFDPNDVPATYQAKNDTLAEVGKQLGGNIRFSCREINGVNLVCMDDTTYRIDREQFEKLKEVEAEGKPILLFMHIPMYSEHLGGGAKYSTGAPSKYHEHCTPMQKYELSTDEQTYEFCDYIRKSPQIRCIFSGHIHYNVEILGKDSQDQLVTGLDTIREVTIC